MQVLLKLGAVQVSRVREELASQLAYTTIQTMLNILERKGHARCEKAGRAHVYSAVGTELESQQQATRQIVELMFYGSYTALAHLADSMAQLPQPA